MDRWTERRIVRQGENFVGRVGQAGRSHNVQPFPERWRAWTCFLLSVCFSCTGPKYKQQRWTFRASTEQ